MLYTRNFDHVYLNSPSNSAQVLYTILSPNFKFLLKQRLKQIFPYYLLLILKQILRHISYITELI